MGGSCARLVFNIFTKSASVPNVSAARMVAVKMSYTIWLSIVFPAPIVVFGRIDGAFSGDIPGTTTSHRWVGSGTRKSTKNCAEPFNAGYTDFRYSLSPE